MMKQIILITASMLMLQAAALFAAPQVMILDGPAEGEAVKESSRIGFTFQATDPDGADGVVPGRGPLIIVAAGDANVNLNPHWRATENMIKIIYRGFHNELNYSHDDIFLIMGKSEIDLNDDSIMDSGIVDHTDMAKASVLSAMDQFMRGAYQKGETVYFWFVGHAGVDGSSAKFTLSQAQGSYLDALSLDKQLTQFQIDRGCDSMVLFIESCYAGRFSKQLDNQNRRITVMAEGDRFAHYSANGVESFSAELMSWLTLPRSLGDAFNETCYTLQNRRASKRQQPSMDANGDGIATFSEPDQVKDFYVGGLRTIGSQPPVILSHTPGALITSESPELFLTASGGSALTSAWVSIVRPDYDPEALAAYLAGEVDNYEEQLELIQMSESSDIPGRFSCNWQNATLEGTYEVTFNVRDTEGRVAKSDPLIFRKGSLPFVHMETDQSVYGLFEAPQFFIELGGSGTADIYSALLFPDGSLHGFQFGAAGIEIGESADLSRADPLPWLVPAMDLFELPLMTLYAPSGTDTDTWPAGAYTWYTILAEPGSSLFNGQWLGLDEHTFYMDRDDSLVERSMDRGDTLLQPVWEERSGRAAGNAPLFSYAWYLEGLESDWGYWSDPTEIAKTVPYTDLTPGDYAFHVKARSSTGQVSDALARHFSVVSAELPDNPDEPVTLTAFAVTPASVSLIAGESADLIATVTYSDGTTQNVSAESDCKWKSSAPSVAAVSGSGRVTGVVAGSAQITADYYGYAASMDVTITSGGTGPVVDVDPNVGVVSVSPSRFTLESVGAVTQLTGSAAMNDGTLKNLNGGVAGVSWQSSDTAVAVVDSGGQVTALSNGTATITCAYGGKSGTAVITVDMPVLSTLRLEPSGGISLGAPGAVAACQATAVYSKGTEMDVTASADWQVDNGAVATIDSSGTVTALGEGQAVITATFGGVSNTLAVTVTFPHPALSVSSTTVDGTAVEGAAGEAQELTITNSGTGDMAFSVQESTDWLTVSPTSGNLGAGASSSVTFSFSAVDLGVGGYQGIVTVMAQGAANSPQYITVNLEVTKQPEIPTGPTGDFSNTLGMSFKEIPAGTFMMGSPDSEASRDSDETQHSVTLTKAYYMQTTEVTQGQWEAVMGSNPSYFDSCGADCPVEKVSWDDIQEFITQLNQRGEGTYRLPTEAEWEYAARAGTSTPFAFGACLSTNQANYDGGYPYEGCPSGEYRSRTVPVASFAPNAWGLYDMHGNVWEWCQDWYGDYPSGAVTDPGGGESGSFRVLRGGSWVNDARYCRSAYRSWRDPANRFNNYGFRLACFPGQ